MRKTTVMLIRRKAGKLLAISGLAILVAALAIAQLGCQDRVTRSTRNGLSLDYLLPDIVGAWRLAKIAVIAETKRIEPIIVDPMDREFDPTYIEFEVLQVIKGQNAISTEQITLQGDSSVFQPGERLVLLLGGSPETGYAFIGGPWKFFELDNKKDIVTTTGPNQVKVNMPLNEFVRILSEYRE